MHRLSMMLALLSAVACQEVDQSAVAKQCKKASAPGAVFEACEEYCQRDCQLDSGACEAECQARLRVDHERPDGCGSASEDVLRCLSVVGCAEGEAHLACADVYTDALQACGGASSVFPGMQVCWVQCQNTACGCGKDVFLGEGDCLAQCKANLELDLVFGCYDEGVRLRSCISRIDSCADYDALLDGDPSSPCAGEEEAWRAACEA